MLEALRDVSDFEGKEGGMFCLLDEQTGEFLVEPTIIGQIVNGKAEIYTSFCQEKARRLLEHIKNGRDNQHWLSWESRNPDLDQWGGAICDENFHIWSFSGLTEEQDEALMIMSAHLCGQMINAAPKWLSEISGNRIILDNPYLFWHKPE